MQFDRGRGRAGRKTSHSNAAVREGHGRVDPADRGVQAQVDVFAHDARGKVQLDTKGTVLDRNCAFIIRDRNGVFTTGKELCGLTGQGRQVRFGQGADKPVRFQCLKQQCDLKTPGVDAELERTVRLGAARDTRGRVAVKQVHKVVALNVGAVAAHKTDVAAISDPADRDGRGQALADRAVHFGKAHLQHDLLAATDDHQVRHAFGGIAVGQIQSAVNRGRRRHGAGQHQAIVGGADLNRFAR